MQGKKKEKLTPEFILSRVSEWQIFQRYLPNFKSLNKKILSPFREEHTPSLRVFTTNGRMYYKDYGDTKYRGDVFDLVQQLEGLDYPEAIKRVAEDFGLIERKDGSRAERIVFKKPEIIEEPVIIQVKIWPKWKEQHRDYLKAYSLAPEDLNFCPDTKAFPLKSWARNGSIMPLDEGEAAFAYNLKNERGDWVKIYRPQQRKEDKWRSSIPFMEMHGLDNMKGCDVGILTKSLKDGAFLAKYILPCVCVIQAEDISAISIENMKFLKESCNTLYIALDCDKRGKEASHAITKEMGVKHINPPDNLLNYKESDFSGMAKTWGVESVIEHFKKKGVIND